MIKDYSASFIPNEMRISIVKVYSYDNQNFEGKLENPYLDRPEVFHNLTQLMLALDDMADDMKCPQRSNEPRTLADFETAHQRWQDGEPEPKTAGKPIATFKILIMFRQYSSWQGRCEWAETRKSANFRSALELVRLMDGVLTSINQ